MAVIKHEDGSITVGIIPEKRVEKPIEKEKDVPHTRGRKSAETKE